MVKISKEKLSLNGITLAEIGYIIVVIEYMKLLDYFKEPMLTYLNEKCNLNMEDTRDQHDQVVAEISIKQAQFWSLVVR